ncbi:ferritin-like domain protein [archaeon]|nr:ferritin-like domain protein [archaeon]
MDIVEMLNIDLSGEIEAILVYMRNSTVALRNVCETGNELEEIALDEMRHADWLSGLIVNLGGKPAMVHRELDFGGKTASDFLKRGIELENGGIEMYKEHISAIDNIKVKEKLQHILKEEEWHLKEFEELLYEQD